MKNIELKKLPRQITVNVSKGQSGCLIAVLPEFDVFTEADNLNELFANVNDLIYTYFDISKKIQEKVWYLPPLAVREGLVEIEKKKTPDKIKMEAFYSSGFVYSNA